MDINVSNEAFSFLMDLCSGKELCPSDFPQSVLTYLKDLGFIELRITGYADSSADLLGSIPLYQVAVTESGRAYTEKAAAERTSVEQHIRSLEEMNRKFSEGLELYKKELEEAKSDTKKAAIRSWVAIIISIAAIAATIVSAAITSGALR